MLSVYAKVSFVLSVANKPIMLIVVMLLNVVMLSVMVTIIIFMYHQFQIAISSTSILASLLSLGGHSERRGWRIAQG